MYTKVLAFLALATIANCNDVIVGLKTNGKKIFDENRQANPALWRQMDNVTIKAPENEVIRRVVITDLRPDKDGDVRIVEGGEGQKNVTIELKSPTVLRGYEFHIEVYSTPEENVPFTNDQKSTTELVQDGSTRVIPNNSATNLDTTSELPDLSTNKVPAILSNDEIKDNERQGRNAKNDDITSEGTTESTSTTFNTDFSSTPTTHLAESATENRSEKSSDTPNKFEHESTISPIPFNKNFNINPAIPAISGRDIANDKFNITGNDETRHVRDTEKEKSGKSIETKLNLNPTIGQFESSTENDKEVTTEISDAPSVEEKSEDKDKEDVMTALKSHTFNNRKYTSIISTKVDNPESPIDVKDSGILRNVRGANEEQKIEESSTMTPSESTTTDIIDETSTPPSDDCVTTETTNPVNFGIDNNKDKTDPIPIYLNSREWNQRFNNPTFQIGDNHSPDLKLNPAVLNNEQSTLTSETVDAEHFGNPNKPSLDHMESRNPKISAISSNHDMK